MFLDELKWLCSISMLVCLRVYHGYIMFEPAGLTDFSRISNTPRAYRETELLMFFHMDQQWISNDKYGISRSILNSTIQI